MKKQITVLLFAALLSVICVSAAESTGISESTTQQESFKSPDFTGTYVMYYNTSRTEYMGGYRKYFLSDSIYVNVSIEKDPEVENQYIVKHFGRKWSLDLTATYNPETGNLEIPRQTIFSNRDIVNVNNPDSPITLTPTADGFATNDVWGSLYISGSSEGQYFEQGSNSALIKPNAVMEWKKAYDESVTHREYVLVEQDGNSSEITIVNFGNFGDLGKSVTVNLENDSVFSIPVQLHYYSEEWNNFGGEWWMEDNNWWYFYAGYDDSWNKRPITGKWTATTMISDGESWLHGTLDTYWGGLTYEDTEGPFTLTMLTGTIISPFATNMLGDANDDGDIDLNDLTTLINYLLDKNPSPFNLTNADVNNSGEVDLNDLTSLINILLSM